MFVKLLYDISTFYKTSFIFNVSANPFANKSHSLFLAKHKSLRVTFSFNASHNYRPLTELNALLLKSSLIKDLLTLIPKLRTIIDFRSK